MPTRLCQQAGCPNPPTYRGRCQRHARQRDRYTHRNRKVYNSKRWAMTRKKQLHLHPLCNQCGVVATDVDHVVPIEQGGQVWSLSNLQSLCALHHGRKTRREQQGVTA